MFCRDGTNRQMPPDRVFSESNRYYAAFVLCNYLGCLPRNSWVNLRWQVSDSDGVKLRQRMPFAQPAVRSLVAVPISSMWPRCKHTASSLSSLNRLLAPGRSLFDCCPAHLVLHRRSSTRSSRASDAILGLSLPRSGKTSITRFI